MAEEIKRIGRKEKKESKRRIEESRYNDKYKNIITEDTYAEVFSEK